MTSLSSDARSHSFSWENPLISAQAARTMSGIAFLSAMGRGELPPPPAMTMLAIRPGDLALGQVTFLLTPAEYHYNPLGTVHGGVISTLADTAMACAIQTTLPAGVGLTTIELKVNFLRALTVASGEVSCTGSVIHVGGRVATAEAKVLDAAGTLYAHATTTCMILRPDPARA